MTKRGKVWYTILYSIAEEGRWYMNPKGIVFDLDGTLLNTLTDLTDAVNYMLKNHGFPLRRQDEIRAFLGNGARNLITQALPEGIDEETLEQCLAEYSAYYTTHSQIATAPYEGIAELLEDLQRRGIKCAIVSNKGDAQVKALAKRHFEAYVTVAVGEREGIRRKPCPDSVLEALRELNVDPADAVLVGDSEVDGETAKNAQIPFVAVTWGFRDRDVLEKCNPAKIIDKPQQLL